MSEALREAPCNVIIIGHVESHVRGRYVYTRIGWFAPLVSVHTQLHLPPGTGVPASADTDTQIVAIASEILEAQQRLPAFICGFLSCN